MYILKISKIPPVICRFLIIHIPQNLEQVFSLIIADLFFSLKIVVLNPILPIHIPIVIQIESYPSTDYLLLDFYMDLEYNAPHYINSYSFLGVSSSSITLFYYLEQLQSLSANPGYFCYYDSIHIEVESPVVQIYSLDPYPKQISYYYSIQIKRQLYFNLCNLLFLTRILITLLDSIRLSLIKIAEIYQYFSSQYITVWMLNPNLEFHIRWIFRECESLLPDRLDTSSLVSLCAVLMACTNNFYIRILVQVVVTILEKLDCENSLALRTRIVKVIVIISINVQIKVLYFSYVFIIIMNQAYSSVFQTKSPLQSPPIFHSLYHSLLPIQNNAVSLISDGFDTILKFKAGSGKTTALITAILHKIQSQLLQIQAIIIVPTRQLVQSTKDTINAIKQQTSSVSCCACDSKSSMEETQKQLKQKKHHILCVTPQKLEQLLKRKLINLSFLKIVAMDQTDQIVSRGSVFVIQNIRKYFPLKAQHIISTSTIPKDTGLFQGFIRSPYRIICNEEQLTLKGVQQYYIRVNQPSFKLEVVLSFQRHFKNLSCVIYVNSDQRVRELICGFQSNDVCVFYFDGKESVMERKQVIQRFLQKQRMFLVIADEVRDYFYLKEPHLIVNYDVPCSKQKYGLRVCRMGMDGKGVVVSLALKTEVERLMSYNKEECSEIHELQNLDSLYNKPKAS